MRYIIKHIGNKYYLAKSDHTGLVDGEVFEDLGEAKARAYALTEAENSPEVQTKPKIKKPKPE